LIAPESGKTFSCDLSNFFFDSVFVGGKSLEPDWTATTTRSLSVEIAA
jgi:hypothetical protein